MVTWLIPFSVSRCAGVTIPCSPTSDHIKPWMLPIEEQWTRMCLSPEHLTCIQFAKALQYTAELSKGTNFIELANCVPAFMLILNEYHEVTYKMIAKHDPQGSLKKPLTPNPSQCHQASVYFDGLPNYLETVVQWNAEKTRGVSFHDSRPDYIKEQQFLKAGSCGHGTLKVKAKEALDTAQATTPPPPDGGNQGQFLDADNLLSTNAEPKSVSEPSAIAQSHPLLRIHLS